MIRKSPTIEKILSEEAMYSVSCPICDEEGKSKSDLIIATYGYPNVYFSNVICKNCGLTRINPRMSQAGYDRFYKEAFFEYLDPYNRPAYVEEFNNANNPNYWAGARRMIMPYIYGWLKTNTGKVLDIGAGYGTILYNFKTDKGMFGVGIDPDPESRKIAKEKFDINILDETVDSFFSKNSDKFDVIVMEQTFEHLLQPLQTLKEIKKILSPEGLLYIGVPNAYKFTSGYELLFQLAHTYNYTPYSLSKLADLAGLRVFNIRDENKHPLEVLICHSEANYPKEKEHILSAGKDYRDVIWEMRKIKYIDMFRGGIKKLLISTVGEEVKNKIKKLVDRK